MEAAAVANGAPVQIPRKMSLFDLPDCMLEQIFEYMSYDEIAKQRIVSINSEEQGPLFLLIVFYHELNIIYKD